MKRLLLLGFVLMFGSMGIMAQNQTPTEQMMKEWRRTIQHQDASKLYLKTNIPLAPNPISESTKSNILPHDRIWFPGEWEEVQAIVVTCCYNYRPLRNPRPGTWFANPLLSNYAEYYKWSNSTGWTQSGGGPYTYDIDTTEFGKVFFYVMDAIQMGGAEAWVRIESASDSTIVLNQLEHMGLRHNNIRFIIGAGNSFWYRDCGPICFYTGEQDEISMLDFTYYIDRSLDDSLPHHIHEQMNIPNYRSTIEWEGGNCLVDGVGMVLSSNKIYEANNDKYGPISWDGQNPNTIQYTQKEPLKASQVKNALKSLIGQRATYILPTFKYDGGTGHIDLYVDMCDENGFVFSQFPDNYSRWTDYKTAKKNIDSLCSYKSIFGCDYSKTTIPFPKKNNGLNFNSQQEYNDYYTRTYSNHTFVNNVIIQPCFSEVKNGQPTLEWDRDNLKKIQDAYPGYTIYPIDVREFDGSGGAIHCITKQIPTKSPIRILHKNVIGNISATMEKIPISAIITNNKGIANAKCIYRINNGNWDSIAMTSNGNKYSCSISTTNMPIDATVEYFIKATNNENKTITKPMTANNGGYFKFTRTQGLDVDYSQFDTNTTNVPMEKITFSFYDNGDPLDIPTIHMDNQFGQFYPNPTHTQANIKIELDDNTKYSVYIVDMGGRTVHNSSLQAIGSIIYTIDASKLSTGIYNIIFSNKTNTIVRRLIVK